MKKLTAREYVLVVLLVILLLGVCYYMLYYTPLQNDLQSIRTQTADTESQTAVLQARVDSMQKMRDELDAIFADSDGEVSEIAPYDNAKVVMSELNGILGQSQSYKLTFSDPSIGADGTVRRSVKLNFTCDGYKSAKRIVENLCSSHWRCLMKDLTVDGDEDVVNNGVNCSATIVFFESTKLQ